MVRFWFKFNTKDIRYVPFGIKMGCGVTAFDYDDAVNLINERVFQENQMPDVDYYIDEIDISTLDSGHVLPNMSDPNKRGIWFPLGFD